jgi:hypothetical protein
VGLIEATPDELLGVGSEIAALGPGVGRLAGSAGRLGSGVSAPPETAAALDRLGGRWATGAARLEDELTAFGRALGASGIAYRVADDSSMRGGP